VRGFAELTLETPDPEGLARFYAEVFGMDELAREEDRIWLEAGPGARLGLWRPGRKEFGDRGGSHVHFAFSVEPSELERIAERLDAAGCEHRGPIEHDGGDRSLYVTDPEGNVVEAWDFFALGDRDAADLNEGA
jgi:catechol-2,3-dioxygenase